MKQDSRTLPQLSLLVAFLAILTGCAGRGVSEELMYLSQPRPGLEPEVFAPGVVSLADRGEFRAAFSPDGRELYFSITTESPDRPYSILFTRYENGRWTEPATPVFSEAGDLEPYFSSDGQRLYFTSNRPPLASDSDYNLWVVERTRAGWSEPEPFAAPINTSGTEWFASQTADGTLHFGSEREGGVGGIDIYSAEPIGGGNASVENIGEPVNSTYRDFDPYVDPQETFIIFCSDRPGGYGASDLYISLRGDDGEWTEPINLEPPINSGADEFAPSMSPDGAYLFFNRRGDLYWVDARALDEFLPTAIVQSRSD